MSRHVLVARLDNLGDVVLAGPAIRAIAAGAERVTLLCSPQGAPVATLLPGVDAVEVFDAPWISQPAPPVDGRVPELIERVARLGIDEAVVFTSFHQSPLPLALLLRMAGVGRIGAISVDYPGSLLDVRHHVDDDVHEVPRALSLAEACGYRLPADDPGTLRFRVRTGDRGRGRAKTLTEAPYVVVHPGATAPARTLAAEQHREVVTLLGEAGRRPVITGSRTERKLTAYVASGHADAIDLGGATDVGGMVDVIAGADAIVVGNTGPAHLAAAVGTPVVSLFAPTVPAVRWRPWAVPHRLLGDQAVPCAGCRALRCPLGHHRCLAGIQPSEVLDAVEELAPRERPASESIPAKAVMAS